MWMTSTTYQPTTLILLHAWDQFMTDVISQIVHFILIIMLNCDLCHLWFTSPNKSISPASLYVQLLSWRHFKKENWHIPFSFILTQNSFHSVRIDHKYFAIKTLTTWTLQKITWVCKFFKRSFAKTVACDFYFMATDWQLNLEIRNLSRNESLPCTGGGAMVIQPFCCFDWADCTELHSDESESSQWLGLTADIDPRVTQLSGHHQLMIRHNIATDIGQYFTRKTLPITRVTCPHSPWCQWHVSHWRWPLVTWWLPAPMTAM